MVPISPHIAASRGLPQDQIDVVVGDNFTILLMVTHWMRELCSSRSGAFYAACVVLVAMSWFLLNRWYYQRREQRNNQYDFLMARPTRPSPLIMDKSTSSQYLNPQLQYGLPAFAETPTRRSIVAVTPRRVPPTTVALPRMHSSSPHAAYLHSMGDRSTVVFSAPLRQNPTLATIVHHRMPRSPTMRTNASFPLANNNVAFMVRTPPTIVFRKVPVRQLTVVPVHSSVVKH